jgi:putative transposase
LPWDGDLGHLAPARPRQLALLETDGWADASTDARRALEDVLKRLTQAGIAIATRYDHADMFWALLASGQIIMRKVDGWDTLATKPSDQPFDLAA